MAENVSQPIHEEKKSYFQLFIGLVILSAVTVFVHYLKLPIALSITIILLTAALQATLSACRFMHLSTEKKIIFIVLGLTATFLIVMIALFIFGKFCLPE